MEFRQDRCAGSAGGPGAAINARAPRFGASVRVGSTQKSASPEVRFADALAAQNARLSLHLNFTLAGGKLTVSPTEKWQTNFQRKKSKRCGRRGGWNISRR